jgi:hypothetical protein
LAAIAIASKYSGVADRRDDVAVGVMPPIQQRQYLNFGEEVIIDEIS